MKKEYIIGILLFGGIWGLSEAILGNVLYAAGVPFSSVYLTVAAFAILAIASVFIPKIGTATAIAATAMLYKFMNSPFFACHLLGILMIGVCWDVCFNMLKVKNSSISAVIATYMNYILFGLMITYVFHYGPWPAGGITKIFHHVAFSGTMTAIGAAIIVPLAHRFAGNLKAHSFDPAKMPAAIAGALVWLFGLGSFVHAVL